VQLKAFVTGRGIRLSYSEDLNGTDGASSGGAIRFRAGLAPAEEFAVAVHELAHELLHHGQDRAQTPRKVQELESEAVAFVVSEAIGLEASHLLPNLLAKTKSTDPQDERQNGPISRFATAGVGHWSPVGKVPHRMADRSASAGALSSIWRIPANGIAGRFR